MATLIEDAIRLIQTPDRRSPAWRRLAHNHGAPGIVLGALIDVFAAGSPRTFQDLQNAINAAKGSGYLSDATMYRDSPYSRREIQGAPPRSPLIAPGPGTSVAPVELGVPYLPGDAQRGGVFRVDTIPRPPDLEAPPTAMGPAPVGDMAPPSVGRRPGGLSTAPGAKSGIWDSRSALSVQTVSEAGKSRDRRAELRARYIENSDYTRGAMLPAMFGAEDIFANMIMTPESSNVHSFTYDEDRGVLYIVYRAPLDPVGTRRWTNSCTGEEYNLQIRPNVPGPMYAYGGRSRPVPKWMFEELKAASSKGTWVWDRLRVCGSFYEHQFPYNLAGPAMEGILYVPRKATRKGFRVRTVTPVGKGRRWYLQSNLPENLFNG